VHALFLGTAVYRPATVLVYVFQVNGQMTLRENIADNGGIREAYRAFKKMKARRGLEDLSPRLPGLERYSPDQLFFISFATVMQCTENLLLTAFLYSAFAKSLYTYK
jgi:predicted metalloendopeptidase